MSFFVLEIEKPKLVILIIISSFYMLILGLISLEFATQLSYLWEYQTQSAKISGNENGLNDALQPLCEFQVLFHLL